MKKNRFLLCISSLLLIGCIVGCEQTSTSSQSTSSNSSSSSTSSVQDEQKVFYVSPEGTALNDGKSIDNPTSFRMALINAKPGYTIYLLDGLYESSSGFKVNEVDGYSNGTAEEPITVTSLSNDPYKVVFDFSSQSFFSSYRGITINRNYWHLKNITVKGAGDNGIYIGGSHNIVENCITTECKDTGLQLGRESSGQINIAEWPSYNLILNCTSFNNSDPKGEDADGFACKLTTGVGNVFDGCIAYNNIDDGWDLYTKSDSGPIGPVTIRNCIAFNNGARTDGFGSPNSDGNGFKLGGERVPNQHFVYNSIAFNNMAHGFTDNSNPGTIKMVNCTSFDNGTRDKDCNNFDMARDTNSINYLSHLLSYCEKTQSKDQFLGSVEYSVFYVGYSTVRFDELAYANYLDTNARGERFEEETSPFVSTIAPDCTKDIHKILRNPDGSVNLGDFLKVNPDSIYATMGKDGKQIGANLHQSSY